MNKYVDMDKVFVRINKIMKQMKPIIKKINSPNFQNQKKRMNNELELYKKRLFEFMPFIGGGGGALGSILDGREIVGAIEKEAYRRAIIHARQRDKILPWFPIWDDITTFRQDNPECSEYIGYLKSISDRLIISGGFPCQDISTAGKGAGINGSRSGLFFDLSRIIREVEPLCAFFENSPALINRGFDQVLGEIAEMGYDARWCIIGGHNAGAPHRRDRLWILAHSHKKRLTRDENKKTPCKKRFAVDALKSLLLSDWSPGPRAQSRIPGEVNGVAHRMERVETTGDGQIPKVASIAWRILTEGLI